METPKEFKDFCFSYFIEMEEGHENEISLVESILARFGNRDISIVKSYLEYMLNSNYSNEKIISIFNKCSDTLYIKNGEMHKMLLKFIEIIGSWGIDH